MPQVKASCDHLCPESWSSLSLTLPFSCLGAFPLWSLTICAPKAPLLIPSHLAQGQTRTQKEVELLPSQASPEPPWTAHGHECHQAHVTQWRSSPSQDGGREGVPRLPLHYLPQSPAPRSSFPAQSPRPGPERRCYSSHGSCQRARLSCASALGQFRHSSGESCHCQTEAVHPSLSLALPRPPPPPQPPHRAYKWIYTTWNTPCSVSSRTLSTPLPLLRTPTASPPSGRPPPTGSPPCSVRPWCHLSLLCLPWTHWDGGTMLLCTYPWLSPPLDFWLLNNCAVICNFWVPLAQSLA